MLKSVALAVLLAVVAASAHAVPRSYRIDPAHTSVIASWNHLGFSTPVAHFGQVEGTIVYDADKPEASRVEVTLPLTGLDSHVPKLDEHLRSADFFDAARHPLITFRSTRVEAAGTNRLKVTGDLTVRGVTRPVVLDVVVNKVGEHPMTRKPMAGFDATTTLQRSAFGLDRGVPNVSDEVTIRISTEAVGDAGAAL